MGPEGLGATAGLIPGTEQEYLGRSPAERGQGRGIIQGNGDDGGNLESLPWQVHWQQGGRGHIADQEGAGVGGVGENTIEDLPQASAFCLRRTV